MIAGHTDPDHVNGLSTDAPTLSRPALMSLLQRLANGLDGSDPWKASAGDIRCAFLTGGYLKRDEELFLHQPSTGFAGLHPEQLVRVKKNIFGLATSPHEWWLDLQRGIKTITVVTNGEEHAFDQCALRPLRIPTTATRRRKVGGAAMCLRWQPRRRPPCHRAYVNWECGEEEAFGHLPGRHLGGRRVCLPRFGDSLPWRLRALSAEALHREPVVHRRHPAKRQRG